MFPALISKDEKLFIWDGVEADIRSDGRSRQDYRPMLMESDIISQANGSARIRLANTDILVGVKADIDTPNADSPNDGKLEFFVDCSANATPVFEGRGGEDLANEISSALARAYSFLSLASLSIVSKHKCWKLHIDVLILECGGNLYDAIALAVKAALFNTWLPKVKGTQNDGGNIDVELSDDLYDCWQFDVSDAPCFVTVCKIGDQLLVDPSAEEEASSTVNVVVSVTDKELITSVIKTGEGSFHANTLQDAIQLASITGKKLNQALNNSLQKEKELRLGKCGFIK